MDQFKFFQEKPLFVTFDGYKIYPNDKFVSVNKCELYGRNLKVVPALTIVERWPVAKRFADSFKVDSRLVYFKHLKNAKQYVSLKKTNQ
jgi:hypothetical protein